MVNIFLYAEFWKQVPPNEPYRVILGDLRDKLYHTRERIRHLLSSGISDIPEEATFINVEQVPYLSAINAFQLKEIRSRMGTYLFLL